MCWSGCNIWILITNASASTASTSVAAGSFIYWTLLRAAKKRGAAAACSHTARRPPLILIRSKRWKTQDRSYGCRRFNLRSNLHLISSGFAKAAANQRISHLNGCVRACVCVCEGKVRSSGSTAAAVCDDLVPAETMKRCVAAEAFSVNRCWRLSGQRC